MRLIERMPSLYRQRLQLLLSKIISKSMHVVGGLFPVSKQCFRYQQTRNQPLPLGVSAVSNEYFYLVPRSQCRLSASGGAAAPPGGMCQLSLPAWPVAAGPTPDNVRPRQVSCRLSLWRHHLAGFGPGGTCHVSPGQGCRHRQVVFFSKLFQRWSFLTIHWRRWSDSSKIQLVLKKKVREQ
jgi:hypothetical protein